MKELQQKELQKILRFLDAIDCKYKIITDDGQEFGGLSVVEKKILKRQLKRPYGDLSKFYKPKLNLQIKIGEVQEIDCEDHNPVDIRSSICSYLGKVWGKGTYTTCTKKNIVEVMKTA
jgi:hypothetical protein